MKINWGEHKPNTHVTCICGKHVGVLNEELEKQLNDDFAMFMQGVADTGNLVMFSLHPELYNDPQATIRKAETPPNQVPTI